MGDARCKFNLATTHYTAGTPFTQSLTVSAVSSANVFSVTGYSVSYSADWFDSGYLTWTSGNNSGYTADIGSTTIELGPALQITLIMQPGGDIQVGDTLTATAGCDRFASTCQNKFRNASQPNGNLVNFRGYPDLAGAIIYKAADGIIASGG